MKCVVFLVIDKFMKTEKTKSHNHIQYLVNVS